MKPFPGMSVTVKGIFGGGSNTQPGLITRVVAPGVVNVAVFIDGRQQTEFFTSLRLYDNEVAADEAISHTPKHYAAPIVCYPTPHDD